jgi:CBS domain containing-hemolysin-like protein
VLPSGTTRVSSRYPVDDLDELFDVKIVDDDVDSVGGLLAKHLGRVPIPGSHVEAHGLRFEAEGVTGRRNRIGTVLVSRVVPRDEQVRSGSNGNGSNGNGSSGNGRHYADAHD